MTNEVLQQFEQRKSRLLEVLDDTKRYFDEYEEYEKSKSFEVLSNNLKDGEFSIVVVGEFSAGKSTFLNALMGEKLLPSFTSETTATINYLKHLKKSPNGRQLEVRYKDTNRQVEYGDATEVDIKRFVSTASDKNVAREIESVTLYLDSPLLDKGVMLVDSPGLNGIRKGHAEVTERQIERSHACIYMFTAAQPGSQTDFEILAQLTKKFNTIFLVLNQIDKIKKSEEAVEEVIERLVESYSTYFPDYPLPEFLPLAAYPALVARSSKSMEYPDNSGKEDHTLEERAEILENSRIVSFENRLWKFLTEGQKTLEEMITPAQTVVHELTKRKNEIEEFFENIENLRDSEEIEQSIAHTEVEIANIRQKLEAQSEEINSEVREIILDLENSVKAKAEFLREKYEGKIQEINDLDDVEDTVSRLQKNLTREYCDIVEDMDHEFSEQLNRKIRAKYREIATALNKELKTANSTNSKLTLNNFELDMQNLQVDLSKYDEETEEIEKRMEELENKLISNDARKVEIRRAEREISRLEKQKAELKEQAMFEVQLLGSRPEVQTITKSREVEVERRGLFGKIAKAFVGNKTRTEQRTENDNSAQKIYDQKQDEIRNKIKLEEQELKERMNNYEKNLSMSSVDLEIERKQIERQKQLLEERRLKYIDEYKEKFDRENVRFLRRLHSDLGDYLNEMRSDVVKELRNQLEGKEQVFVKIILTAVEKQFSAQINEKQQQLNNLKEMLESSQTEQANKKKALAEELELIEQIAMKAVTILSELESIKPDTIKNISKQVVNS
ncbi:dynamin family protein [Bacillus sp. FJAT-42315]|uniref:dynamin family protein n=1 Tax=Bacillus sp. FJAT-42315 TaxID=2014077 RepID=UPI000C2409DD|nr:dynamin family protein [Bacillus sp. FJAT-42315]